jgi:hypothetical protein
MEDVVKSGLLAAGLGLLMCAAAYAGGTGESGNNTTIVRDANGVATITQSGDPSQAVVKVEKSPGRTTVYRQSGGNTAIVTMGSGAPGAGDIPEWLRKYLDR